MTLANLNINRTKIIVLSLVFTGLWTCLCAVANTQDVAEYDRTLSSLSSELQIQLKNEIAHPGSTTSVLKSVSLKLPDDVDVTIPKGNAITVNYDILRSSLNDAVKNTGKSRVTKLKAIIERIETQREAARNMVTIDRAKIERSESTLKSVLAGQEYQPSWRDRLSDIIERWFFGLFRNLSIPPEISIVLLWILLGVVAVSLVVAVGYLVWWLLVRASLVHVRPRSQHEKAHPAARVPTQISMLDEAERYAAEGRYKEAYRAIYLAAILALDRAKLVKYVDGVTNWEYLIALAKHDRVQAVSTFKTMTTAFDKLIYGKQSVAEDDYLQSRAQYSSLLEVLS